MNLSTNFTAKSNSSNDSSSFMEFVEFCSTPQYLNWSLFIECYVALAKENLFYSAFGLCVAFGAFTANLTVAIMIISKPVKLTVFDQILIGHCIVDGLTGVVDMPIFHITTFMGYWPFSEYFCYWFSIYDNNINVTTSLHMLYITWVRLRSIQAPKSYHKEFLMRRPVVVMACIWALGLGTWAIITFSYGVPQFQCEPNITPYYINPILNVFDWLIPMMGIFILACMLIRLLHQSDRKKSKFKSNHKTGNSVALTHAVASTSNTNTGTLTSLSHMVHSIKRFRLGAQAKFMIIIVSYWVQWFIPCVVVIMDPLCFNCVNSNLYGAIYWLTYTVCVTDPLVVMMVNTNVPCFDRNTMS